jgi:hypothetical protein
VSAPVLFRLEASDEEMGPVGGCPYRAGIGLFLGPFKTGESQPQRACMIRRCGWRHALQMSVNICTFAGDSTGGSVDSGSN